MWWMPCCWRPTAPFGWGHTGAMRDRSRPWIASQERNTADGPTARRRSARTGIGCAPWPPTTTAGSGPRSATGCSAWDGRAWAEWTGADGGPTNDIFAFLAHGGAMWAAGDSSRGIYGWNNQDGWQRLKALAATGFITAMKVIQRRDALARHQRWPAALRIVKSTRPAGSHVIITFTQAEVRPGGAAPLRQAAAALPVHPQPVSGPALFELSRLPEADQVAQVRAAGAHRSAAPAGAEHPLPLLPGLRPVDRAPGRAWKPNWCSTCPSIFRRTLATTTWCWGRWSALPGTKTGATPSRCPRSWTHVADFREVLTIKVRPAGWYRDDEE